MADLKKLTIDDKVQSALTSQEALDSLISNSELLGSDLLFSDEKGKITKERNTLFKLFDKEPGINEVTALRNANIQTNLNYIEKAAKKAKLDTDKVSKAKSNTVANRNTVVMSAKAAGNAAKKASKKGIVDDLVGVANAAAEGDGFFDTAKIYYQKKKETQQLAYDTAVSGVEALAEKGYNLKDDPEGALKEIGAQAKQTGSAIIEALFHGNTDNLKETPIGRIGSALFKLIPDKLKGLFGAIGSGIKKALPLITYAIPFYYMMKDQEESKEYDAEVAAAENVQKAADLITFNKVDSIEDIHESVASDVEGAQASIGSESDELVSEAEKYLANSSAVQLRDTDIQRLETAAMEGTQQLNAMQPAVTESAIEDITPTDVTPTEVTAKIEDNELDLSELSVTKGDQLTQESINNAYQKTMETLVTMSEDDKDSRDQIVELLSNMDKEQANVVVNGLNELNSNVKEVGEQAALAVKAAAGAEKGEEALEEAIQGSNEANKQSNMTIAEQIQSGFEGLSEETLAANPVPPKRSNLIRDLMTLWAGHNLGLIGKGKLGPSLSDVGDVFEKEGLDFWNKMFGKKESTAESEAQSNIPTTDDTSLTQADARTINDYAEAMKKQHQASVEAQSNIPTTDDTSVSAPATSKARIGANDTMDTIVSNLGNDLVETTKNNKDKGFGAIAKSGLGTLMDYGTSFVERIGADQLIPETAMNKVKEVSSELKGDSETSEGKTVIIKEVQPVVHTQSITTVTSSLDTAAINKVGAGG